VPDKFDIILNREKEGNQVVESEDGINILLIGPDVAHALYGKVIGYRETSQEVDFTIS